MGEVVLICPTCKIEWVFSDEEIAALRARHDIAKGHDIELGACHECNRDEEEEFHQSGKA